MERSEFWNIIAEARANATANATQQRSFHEALIDLLASRSKQEILEYEECFDAFHGAIERWDMWAAADLIAGGCSDDSFMDFRAGLIAFGREWYERAAAAPDSLAEHPRVIAAASNDDSDDLFYEEVNYAAAYAFNRVAGDEGESFYEAWERYHPASDPQREVIDRGEDFDFDDPHEMRRRLPRLSALYPPKGTA